MRTSRGRLGSPPGDVGEPGRTCPLGAVCMVIQDMLALKYGCHIDEADFMSKARVRCDQNERLSPESLVHALNSEPALKLKDAGNERLLQVRLSSAAVRSFAELRSSTCRWQGTASAVAAVALGEGGGPQLVAPYREAYGDASRLVAKARAPANAAVRVTDLGVGPAPLVTFAESGFRGAIVLDPVIEGVFKFERDEGSMLELAVPPLSAEFQRAAAGRSPEAEMAEQACRLLAQLAPPAGAEPRLQRAAAEACSLAVAVLSRHSSNATVQTAACGALGQLAPACGGDLPAPEARQCVELVAAAMRRHAGAPRLQEAACHALAGCAGGRPELQALAATNGAIDQVVGAMRQFPLDAEVQRWACGALAGLAADQPMTQSAVAGCRGIEAVVEAMEQHRDSVDLQTMACGAICNLAASHHSNQTAIATQGGLGLILQAMSRHRSSAELQLSAIGALWCLVDGHLECKSVVMQAGGVAQIAAAVEHHPGELALRDMATGALQALVPGLQAALAGAHPAAAQPGGPKPAPAAAGPARGPAGAPP